MTRLPSHEQLTAWLLVVDQVTHSFVKVLGVIVQELEEVRATLPPPELSERERAARYAAATQPDFSGTRRPAERRRG